MATGLVGELQEVRRALEVKDRQAEERERRENISAWTKKLRAMELKDLPGLVELITTIANNEYATYSKDERDRFKRLETNAELVVQGIEPQGGIDEFWAHVAHFIKS